MIITKVKLNFNMTSQPSQQQQAKDCSSFPYILNSGKKCKIKIKIGTSHISNSIKNNLRNITNVIRQIFLLRPLQNLIRLTPSAWNALRLRKHIYKRLNSLLRSWRTRWRANTGFQKGEKASNTLITRLGNFKMMWGVVNDFKSVSPRWDRCGANFNPLHAPDPLYHNIKIRFVVNIVEAFVTVI